jgi:hypothetical protein
MGHFRRRCQNGDRITASGSDILTVVRAGVNHSKNDYRTLFN